MRSDEEKAEEEGSQWKIAAKGVAKRCLGVIQRGAFHKQGFTGQKGSD
jgi:hypothetical protein